jgi:two-component system response regulator YesN
MEELNSWLSVLRMKFAHNSFFFFIVKIDPEDYESWNNQDRDFFLLYVREQVERYYDYKRTDILKIISCYRQDGLISFLVNIDEAEYSKEKEAASVILSKMDDEISNLISIAVSAPITDLSELNKEYKETLTYFKYVFICGNKNIFDREKVEKFDSNNGIYDTAFKKNFKTLLKLCKCEDLKMEIAEFYTQVRQKNYSYLYLHTLSAEIINMILHEFQSNDIPLPQFAKGDLMTSFTKLRSIERCVQWYSDLLDVYAEGIKSRSHAIDGKYMKDILNYIDVDIQTATLNSVADKFKISTAHLSRMFKKQTGMNFSDYVTEKRLDHACHLLLTTDMKIAEVVSTMGYQNINYFNKIFKLKYNITPSQYRKQNSIGE